MPVKKSLGRVQTGINGMDALVGGGFPESSMISVKGQSGSGKSVLAMQFLYYGVSKLDTHVAYITFSQTESQFYKYASSLGFDFKKYEDNFTFLQYEPNEVVHVIEEGGGIMRDILESTKSRRIAVDSLTPYLLLFENNYRRNWGIKEFYRLLKEWQCTALITLDDSASLAMPNEPAIALADGLIDLYHDLEGNSRVRSLEIVKLRESAHSERLIKFSISKSGIVLGKAKTDG